MAAYPHLFLPLKVGSHFLKNRIVMAPVETGLEKQDYLDPRVVEFYEERARGDGPGLFILGNGVVHETGLRNLKDPVLTAGLLNNAVRLTSVIHESGSKVLLQLQHHGAGADHMFAVSASRFRNRDTGRTLHRAPGLLVSHLISQYALFAYHAILHGEFDGVEIYGGRLSLPNVFSSRLFNRRHDKWGLQARTLFAVELVRRIRSFVGPAPIISYRLSLLDLHAGGSEWHDLLAFALALHYEGVNLFSFDIGFTPNSVPVNSDLTPAGVWVPFMEKFSREIKVPVIFGHRMPGPDRLDDILQNNITSLVEIGRPLIADARWVEHVHTGAPIRPCTLCPHGCTRPDRREGREMLACIADPYVLRRSHKHPGGLDILVVGGGPAGMAAAREGALRGHKVTLVDEGSELGGLYRLCAKIQGRSSIAELLKVQERELVELGVEIIRNTRATAQWIEDNYSGSRILLATGKESCMPDIPGIDTPNVLSLEDLLQGRVPVGHRVAVIGSGNVAVDVTRYLCTHDLKAHDEWCCAWGIGDPAEHIGGTLGVVPHLNPAPRKVYLINETNETTEELFAHERRLYEVQWLRMHGVNIFDEANVEQIDSHSVRVSCEGEEGSTILRVDHIVAVGDREANAELQNELTELGIPFEAAGSMKFKAPFGTAGEAALDGIYVLQALEKRSL